MDRNETSLPCCNPYRLQAKYGDSRSEFIVITFVGSHGLGDIPCLFFHSCCGTKAR